MACSATFKNCFLQLPPSTAVLLISVAFGLTNGHALPRQTKTIDLHELNVVPFPQPTEAPALLSDLLRRQAQNTVCGYIGGDPNLPATCLAGSHCVLEQDHGVVGCCPDGGICETGIFTGCVDLNSSPQTEINPYVYTCQGSDLCYRNQFAGGYYQFGCGTASSLGTTVETTAEGMASIVFEETSMPLTALPVPLSEPTPIGTQPASSATADPAGNPSSTGPDAVPQTSSDATLPSGTSVPTSVGSHSSSSLPSTLSSSLHSSSSSSSSSTTTTLSSSSTGLPNTTGTPTSSDGSPAESSTDPSAPATGAGTGTTNKGAIIGGSISGAAVLIAVLVAIILYYLRKRRGNDREGPGPLPTNAPPTTSYISPMRSHGAAFAPLPSWQDDDEDRRPLTQYANNNGQQPYYPASEPWRTGPAPAPAAARANANNRGFSQPLRYHPATIRMVPPAGVGTGLAPVAEEENPQEHDYANNNINNNSSEYDRGVSSSEIDDFSRAYSSAGIGTQEMEYDRQPLTVINPDDTPPRSGASSPGTSPPRSTTPGNRPLWQQNRQRGRNLMWVDPNPNNRI